jgi:hypothetical protein
MLIRRPLSTGYGWYNVSLYRSYADLARENIRAGRYFEAIVVCCVGFDVLVNTLPDRIRLYHNDKLTPEQQTALGLIEASDILTAGGILTRLRKAVILHWRLDRALQQFNQKRNEVIHPLERQERANPDGGISYFLALKSGVTVPYKATSEEAESYYRYFCHIIDLSGGESPRKNDRYPTLADLLRKRREKRRWTEDRRRATR